MSSNQNHMDLSNNSSSTRGLRLGGDLPENEGQELTKLYDKSWAVIVGINNYGGPHARLDNAVRDAQAVAQLLKETYKFSHVIPLYDEQATQKTILHWLKDELPERVKPNDRVIFFFAGHGASRRSAEHIRGYLIPHSASDKYSDYIDMTELREACEFILAKHILIILDCCFAGIAAITQTYRSALQAPPKTLNQAYLRHITDKRAWQVLTAGASDERAADSGSRPGHSAFTSVLLTGLEGQADQNRDGLITALDLANYLRPKVTEESSRNGRGQTPFFNHLIGSGEGDFVFLKPGQKMILQPEGILDREIKPLLRQYLVWVWGLALVLSLVLAGLGWVIQKSWEQQRILQATIEANNTMLANISAAESQAAIAAATNEAVTATAIVQAPQRMKTEVFATFYAEATSTAKALANEREAIDNSHPATEVTVTPTDVPTLQPTPTPTNTPTPTGTATPTDTSMPIPTKTFAPTPDQAVTAAAVVVRQTQTAEAHATQNIEVIKANCPEGPQGNFRDYWDKYKGRLGCPKYAQLIDYGLFAYQLFEHGFMFWAERPQGVVLVMIPEGKPAWYEMRDWSFFPDSAPCAGTPPPPGLKQPVRAFGGVWCDNPSIKAAIGWGTEDEHGIGGAIQEFDGGFIIRDEDQNKAYILFKDTQTYLQETRP